MLNIIWLSLILLAIVFGVINGKVSAVALAITDSAKLGFTIALGLAGVMIFWLGLMRIAEQAGLIQLFAHALRPVLRRLFPEIPDDHPALGAIVMNSAANMLGLNNAATPFGLRAMQALETLNPHPGTASNAMCTFLAINTSSVQLIPVTGMALLAAGGAKQPSAIILSALLATSCSTLVAIIAAKVLEKLPCFRIKESTL